MVLSLYVSQLALSESETDTSNSDEEPPYHIDYVYTRELITSYYHLYGNVLDDFVEINLFNKSDSTAWFLIETEIDPPIALVKPPLAT